MTRTLEENAADERFAEIARQQVADNESYLEVIIEAGGEIEYEDWAEKLGLDTSFFGDGETIPGTGVLFDTAMEVYEETVDKLNANLAANI